MVQLKFRQQHKVFTDGQSVFEGLKAYKKMEEVALFRPDENFKRLNNSLARLEMPQVNEGELLEGLKQLVDLERMGSGR